jgi:TPR repeat protein
MKTLGRHLLTAVVAVTLGASAQAQQNPGLSAQPSGRTLSEPTAPPIERPVDLSRAQPESVSLNLTSEEDDFFAPAMRGEAWAQTKLGKYYVTTGGDETRTQQGINLLRAAAEQNDAEAIYLLATMTAAGAGIEQSDVDAFVMMQRAADLGFADAQFALASIYGQGRGVDKNDIIAEQWARRAAEQGHTLAMFALGRTLIELPEQSRKAEALKFLEGAATAGHGNSAIFLATVKARGDFGVAKDERAAELILKPLAQAGDAECQFALSNLYQSSETFAAQRQQALDWLQRAADQGHTKAAEALKAWPKKNSHPPY